jgi:citrate synthase
MSHAVDDFTKTYSQICYENSLIDNRLYAQYGVKRGLRDITGQGVRPGLTHISRIQSQEKVDRKLVP